MISMDISKLIPIVMFDDQCYLCTKFARMVSIFACGRFSILGHYSPLGKKIRDEILDESALDMFWLINKENAYGGRAALLPLLRAIISTRGLKPQMSNTNDTCEQECKTVKSVFIRSASLFSNSRKISLKSK